MRVLLVEDDSALAEVIVEALAQEGHQTVRARDHAHARRLARAETWDAFVVDGFGGHLEPDEDYRRALRELATRGRVVVATGRAWGASVAAAELGADALLTKPYDLGVLAETLNRLAASRGVPAAAGSAS